LKEFENGEIGCTSESTSLPWPRTAFEPSALGGGYYMKLDKMSALSFTAA